MIRRREFITLLGGAGAAGAWPLAARAQQRDRIRRIGVLLPAAGDNPQFQAWVGAFQKGLASLDWTIGHNVCGLTSDGPRAMRPKFADTRRNWPRSAPTLSWLMATAP